MNGGTHDGASRASATMAEVAREANVSRATVSRVLSGTSHVSPAVKRAVDGAIARLGYVPNVMAQNLAARTSDMLGLLLRDPRIPAYGMLHSELQRGVSRAGLHLLSAVPDITDDEGHERAALDRLIGLRVAGLIAATGLLSSELIAPLARRLPVIVVGRPETHPEISSISYDEHDNARLLADLVVNYGHRRVAIVAPTRGTEGLRMRLLCALLQERGVQVTTLTADFFGTEDEHCESVIALARAQKITAVMFPSDRRLVRFLVEARRAGLRVPEDLSATGFDGINDMVGLLGLTTVRLPVKDAAERAVAVMQTMLTNPAQAPVRHEYLRGHLEPGRTLAPAPSEV